MSLDLFEINNKKCNFNSLDDVNVLFLQLLKYRQRKTPPTTFQIHSYGLGPPSAGSPGIVELVETPPKLDRISPEGWGPWGWRTLGMADPNRGCIEPRGKNANITSNCAIIATDGLLQ